MLKEERDSRQEQESLLCLLPLSQAIGHDWRLLFRTPMCHSPLHNDGVAPFNDSFQRDFNGSRVEFYTAPVFLSSFSWKWTAAPYEKGY